MDYIKIIFNGLGPHATYQLGAKKYRDGDVIAVDPDTAMHLTAIQYAVGANPESVLKIQRLVSLAEEARVKVSDAAIQRGLASENSRYKARSKRNFEDDLVPAPTLDEPEAEEPAAEETVTEEDE